MSQAAICNRIESVPSPPHLFPSPFPLVSILPLPPPLPFSTPQAMFSVQTLSYLNQFSISPSLFLAEPRAQSLRCDESVVFDPAKRLQLKEVFPDVSQLLASSLLPGDMSLKTLMRSMITTFIVFCRLRETMPTYPTAYEYRYDDSFHKARV